MNAQRRKALDTISSKLNELADELDDLASDEEEAGENIPESFEERKQQYEDNVDNIAAAAEALRDAIDCIGEMT
ncbi:MAG: hypothetical protein IJL52_07950 [Clostridia bacterium]|nr:hypothetical protein [Clostridia bacterium]